MWCWLPVLVLAGCSAAEYQKAADREVYGIIAKRQAELLGGSREFSVDTPYSGRAPEEVSPSEVIGGRADDGQRLMTLTDALALAATNNRPYQLQRETLYLAGLDLTGARHRFAIRATVAQLKSGINRNTEGGLRGDASGEAAVSKLLKAGGTVTASLANDLVLYFDGKPKVPDITLELTQPLLRGAGSAIAAELLTQAERDVVYAVRDFSQYQKSLAVQVVGEYYRLLQGQDSVRNSYQNYLSLIAARQRAEAMADAEQLPRFQVDQALQKELGARVGYIRSVESYRQDLDSFKKTLGLPLGERVALDDDVLTELNTRAEAGGLTRLPVPDRGAFALAVTNRLDVMNAIDKFEDSKRKVMVAADALRPGLALVADASLKDQFYDSYHPDEFRARAGLTLDLPLDRLTERNAYRSARINFEKELRLLQTTLDGLREELRQGLRGLEETRQNYLIQLNARTLARQRVQVMPLLLQAGQADIRDQLEAEADLLSAENAVTKAVVDFHIARLTFLKNLGVLSVEADQFWLPNQPAPGGEVPDNTLPNVPTPQQVFGN